MKQFIMTVMIVISVVQFANACNTEGDVPNIQCYGNCNGPMVKCRWIQGTCSCPRLGRRSLVGDIMDSSKADLNEEGDLDDKIAADEKLII